MLVAGSAQALMIEESSVRKLTAGQEYLIDPWPGAFAFDGDRVVWIVWELDGTFALYCLDAAGAAEPVVLDVSSSLPLGVAISGDKVVWDVADGESGESNILRVIDLSLPEESRTFDLHAPHDLAVGRYAIDGNRIGAVWTNGEISFLEVIDVSDPAAPVNYPLAPVQVCVRAVAVHGPYFVFSYLCEDGSGESVIVVNKVDEMGGVGWQFHVPGTIDELDVDDDVIVGIAWYQMYRYDIFLIGGYADAASARVDYFWRNLSAAAFGAEVDGDVIVWRGENGSEGCLEETGGDPWKMCGYSLAGGYIRDEGDVCVSMLRQSGGFSPEYRGVHLSNGQIVWSEYDENWVLDLYLGAISLSCPDMGLVAADLNADCVVNMGDLAVFASQWLMSTAPAGR